MSSDGYDRLLELVAENPALEAVDGLGDGSRVLVEGAAQLPERFDALLDEETPETEFVRTGRDDGEETIVVGPSELVATGTGVHPLGTANGELRVTEATLRQQVLGSVIDGLLDGLRGGAGVGAMGLRGVTFRGGLVVLDLALEAVLLAAGDGVGVLEDAEVVGTHCDHLLRPSCSASRVVSSRRLRSWQGLQSGVPSSVVSRVEREQRDARRGLELVPRYFRVVPAKRVEEVAD